MFSKELIGTKVGPFEFPFTWKDVVLYALGVGAGEDQSEECFVYEKNLKVLPTFGAIPQPVSPISLPKRTVSDVKGMLHMENELIIHKTLDPRGGKLFYETAMEKLYDRGPGKGAKMVIRTDVYDELGDLVYENHDALFSRADGGWGGEMPPRNENNMPDREPDIVDHAVPPVTQPMLYRLGSRDLFPLHIDRAFAEASGFERPIMHGLCTYGYACRMSIKKLFPGEPERLRRINACFMKSLYPGDPICLQLWITGEKEARFQIVNERTGEIPIGKGVLEWV